jgi:hypothetical protein
LMAVLNRRKHASFTIETVHEILKPHSSRRIASALFIVIIGLWEKHAFYLCDGFKDDHWKSTADKRSATANSCYRTSTFMTHNLYIYICAQAMTVFWYYLYFLILTFIIIRY